MINKKTLLEMIEEVESLEEVSYGGAQQKMAKLIRDLEVQSDNKSPEQQIKGFMAVLDLLKTRRELFAKAEKPADFVALGHKVGKSFEIDKWREGVFPKIDKYYENKIKEIEQEIEKLKAGKPAAEAPSDAAEEVAQVEEKVADTLEPQPSEGDDIPRDHKKIIISRVRNLLTKLKKKPKAFKKAIEDAKKDPPELGIYGWDELGDKEREFAIDVFLRSDRKKGQEENPSPALFKKFKQKELEPETFESLKNTSFRDFLNLAISKGDTIKEQQQMMDPKEISDVISRHPEEIEKINKAFNVDLIAIAKKKFGSSFQISNKEGSMGIDQVLELEGKEFFVALVKFLKSKNVLDDEVKKSINVFASATFSKANKEQEENISEAQEQNLSDEAEKIAQKTDNIITPEQAQAVREKLLAMIKEPEGQDGEDEETKEVSPEESEDAEGLNDVMSKEGKAFILALTKFYRKHKFFESTEVKKALATLLQYAKEEESPTTDEPKTEPSQEEETLEEAKNPLGVAIDTLTDQDLIADNIVPVEQIPEIRKKLMAALGKTEKDFEEEPEDNSGLNPSQRQVMKNVKAIMNARKIEDIGDGKAKALPADFQSRFYKAIQEIDHLDEEVLRALVISLDKFVGKGVFGESQINEFVFGKKGREKRRQFSQKYLGGKVEDQSRALQALMGKIMSRDEFIKYRGAIQRTFKTPEFRSLYGDLKDILMKIMQAPDEVKIDGKPSTEVIDTKPPEETKKPPGEDKPEESGEKSPEDDSPEDFGIDDEEGDKELSGDEEEEADRSAFNGEVNFLAKKFARFAIKDKKERDKLSKPSAIYKLFNLIYNVSVSVEKASSGSVKAWQVAYGLLANAAFYAKPPPMEEAENRENVALYNKSIDDFGNFENKLGFKGDDSLLRILQVVKRYATGDLQNLMKFMKLKKDFIKQVLESYKPNPDAGKIEKAFNILKPVFSKKEKTEEEPSIKESLKRIILKIINEHYNHHF